jgi:hypothetical protein
MLRMLAEKRVRGRNDELRLSASCVVEQALGQVANDPVPLWSQCPVDDHAAVVEALPRVAG